MLYYTKPERPEVNARIIDSEFWQQFAEYGLADVEVRVQVRRDGLLEMSPYSKHLYEYRPGNDASVLGQILVGDEFWH